MGTTASSTFVTTRWTRVLAARGGSDASRVALSELCSSYYGPVVAFLAHTGCGDEEPREVAHDFFARLLARDELAGVDPARGRFRSYLLGALKHFAANRRVRAAREKRGGDAEHQPLTTGTDTGTELPIAAGAPCLEQVFDREWAVAIVERALAVLADEAASADTSEQFAVLKAWLSFGDIPGLQSDAAVRLGINEGAVKVAVHRLRKRFREVVRAEVAQTVPAGDDVEAELHHLVEALALQPAG